MTAGELQRHEYIGSSTSLCWLSSRLLLSPPLLLVVVVDNLEHQLVDGNHAYRKPSLPGQ